MPNYKPVKKGEPLSPREMELWKYLTITGFDKKQIATHFDLDTKTVDIHLYHCCKKLGVHSCRELIVLGWKSNIPNLEDAPVVLTLYALKAELDEMQLQLDKLIEIEKAQWSPVQTT